MKDCILFWVSFILFYLCRITMTVYLSIFILLLQIHMLSLIIMVNNLCNHLRHGIKVCAYFSCGCVRLTHKVKILNCHYRDS